MSRKTTGEAKERLISARSGPDEERDLSTLSVRFTDEQRELLSLAAELRGWTPTGLIRTAAMERAAHIVNTSRVTKFDFKVLASEISTRLFQRRSITYKPEEEELEGFYDDLRSGKSVQLDIPVDPLPLKTLFQLKNAARLGGVEFLSAVIDFAESLTASQRQDLPDPVDPTKTEV